MNTRVFISGKIEGNDNYFEEFENAEKKLSVLDYSVVNPAKILKPLSDTNGFFTHDEYMEICFTLIDMCDAIYQLPTWTDSEGAQEEYAYALRRKMAFIHD